MIIARNKVERKETLRNIVLMERVCEVDLLNEEESITGFYEYIFEEICGFSFDIVGFSEWLSLKKSVNLIPSEEKKKNEAALAVLLQKTEEDETEKLTSMNKKPPSRESKIKEKKKDPKEIEREEEELREKERLLQLELEVERKKKEEEDKKKRAMIYYNKQMKNLKEEMIGVGVILECLVDEIVNINKEVGSSSELIKLEEQQDFVKISQTLEMLSSSIKNPSQNLENLKTKENIQNITNVVKKTDPFIYDELDESSLKSHRAVLLSDELIIDRENQIFSNMVFPGINRHLLPEIPDKSELLRKTEVAKFYPFVRSSYDFIEISFSDRIYLEKHNTSTLRQSLYNALLNDCNVLHKYLEKEDALLLIIYYKTPNKRVYRKQWIADWRVLPNLENFIQFFKTNSNNLNNEIFYDIDYKDIGNLHTKIKYMYPSDKSVIYCYKYLIGECFKHCYKVIKEGLNFGIKINEPMPEVTKNIHLKACFWAQLADQTRVFAEFENEGSEKGKVSSTLTMPYGLMVKMLPSGDVFQSYEVNSIKLKELNKIEHGNLLDKSELNRMITGKGSVIRYLKDGTKEVLYANGNVAVYSDGVWVTTNNKGLRRSKRVEDNLETELDPVQCAKRTENKTDSRILMREDNVLVITFQDGSLFTRHKDGTRMFTSALKNKIMVEHDSYATVKLSFTNILERTKTEHSYSIRIFEAEKALDLIERSSDGKITEVFLPNDIVIHSFKEKQEREINQLYLYQFKEGTTIKILENGKVNLMSGKDFPELSNRNEEIFNTIFNENLPNVYKADLRENDSNNSFSYYCDGRTDMVWNPIVLDNVGIVPEGRPQTPNLEELEEFVDPDSKDYPENENKIDPRLFIIKNDNTGAEFHNSEQMKNYLRLKKLEEISSIKTEEKTNDFKEGKAISFATRCVEWDTKKHFLIDVTMPEELDLFGKFEDDVPKKAKEIVHTFRTLIEFPEFSEEKREEFLQDVENYEQWAKLQIRAINEFGYQNKSKEEKDESFQIMKKFFEARKMEFIEQSYDNYKAQKVSKLKSKLPSVILPPAKKPEMYIHEVPETKDIVKVKNKMVAKASNISQTKFQSTQSNGNIRREFFVTNYFITKDGEKYIMDNGGPGDSVARKEKIERLRKLKQVPALTQMEIESRKKIDDLLEEKTEKNLRGEEEFYEEIVENNPLEREEPIITIEEGIRKDYQKPQNRTTSLIQMKNSVFTEMDRWALAKKMEEERNADAYHKAKTPKFNLYGSDRKTKENVKSLMRTHPKSEINQKFILIEGPTENRVKISSLANRLYTKGFGINEVRNSGQHQIMLKTIDKKNRLEELMEKKNLMITADVTDKLKRNLLIIPITARFGSIKIGGIYETSILVKNEDILTQRITLKNPRSRYCRVFIRPDKEGNILPIPMGITREIIVKIHAVEEIIGNFQDEFQIIPIKASVLDAENYDNMDFESKELTGKSLLKGYVREVYMKPNSEQIEKQNDSRPSSEKLPKITNFDRNTKLTVNLPDKSRKTEEHSNY